jgi:cyclic beta-1,2-glucan synthetase
MRTSPTNIGLQLLATVSARDLGFITLDDMARRLELAFRTLERMRRMHGHFYNWYDLTDLRVLEPAYISTVDSGNLAGHLIALRQACLAIAEESPLKGRIGRAIDVALLLTEEQRRKAIPTHPALKRILTIRRQLAQAGRENPSAEALSRLAHVLRRYESEIGSASVDSEEIEALTQWTSWSLRLISAHQEWMKKLGVRSREGIRRREARLVTRDSRLQRCASWL